jgi:IS30 family transposase
MDGRRGAPRAVVRPAAAITQLPTHLAKSLTWDLGHQMAEHQRFTTATGMTVYFCDPEIRWQPSSNENANDRSANTYPGGSTTANSPRTRPKFRFAAII